MTNAGYVDAVQEQLPAIPPSNVIGEPAVRGTAAAIAYGAFVIASRDPAATMFSLHADHHITVVAAFRQALETSAVVAAEDYLVTLGIRPAYADTGYGYIERGQALDAPAGSSAYRVRRFTEKPDADQAQAFVSSGRYYWNSGLFTWQVTTILDAFARHMPDTYAKLGPLADLVGTAQEAAALAEVWPTLQNQTIDYGIMERAERVAVVPADFGWSDVGTWDALYAVMPGDADANVISGDHLVLDTCGSLIYGDGRLIAAVGVKDLIVVDTGDVVLVCPRDRAQEVKAIVDQLKRAQRDDVL
jgi:mannose-1-phosphate guanylyltransferase